MDNIAICEMSTSDIEKELSLRESELLDYIPGKTYKIWLCYRIQALRFELEERCKQN